MRLGDTVKLGYVDQSRDTLADGKTVWEEISDGLDELQLGNRQCHRVPMSACLILRAVISKNSWPAFRRRA